MLSNNLKEKNEYLADYFNKPAWANRILFYASIFLSIASIFLFIIVIFKFLFSDFSILNNIIYTQNNATQLNNMGFFDNERYLLSALVQSLAATIALVITLSLVAVQLAAQSYSARVIDVYKRNPDMWILLCIYIFTIFYGLGLTKIIGLGILGNYMEGAIFVAYFMGFFAFVCLVPYILDTLASLKPLTLIQILAKDVTKKRILDYLIIKGQKSDKDPILPIVDVINSALTRNDEETVRNGILELTETTLDIFKLNYVEKNDSDKILKHLIQHIEKIGMEAAEKENENSSISVISALDDIKRKAIELNLEKTTQITEKSLENMKIKVLQHKLESATKSIIQIYKKEGIEEFESGLKNIAPTSTLVISQICMETIEKKMDIAADVGIGAIKDIGLKAVDFENYLALVWIIAEIDNIGVKAATDKNDFIAKTSVKALRHIVEPVFKNEKWLAFERIVYALNNIILAADNKLETTTEAAIDIFATISRWAIENNYEDRIIIDMLKKLEDMANQSIDEKLESQFMSISIAIQNIGTKAADKARVTIMENIIEILEPIGIKAAEQNQIQPQWMVINVFKEMGIKAAENGLKKEKGKYKDSLIKLSHNVDATDAMQEMFIYTSIEEALEDIENAKVKRRNA
ncbi:DUF2254 family protein [Methanolobus sediminis]|uniref:DUF2254 family protein n=1 Tax=Methanolobus sediminis TaxID=3072978 RepID=A0AA51UI66_9EURY|nr:DUF2254 family protein [Methanolobus sediminis]WMW23962.1 DUF2254 family protein [Methanolobus sediminis]